MTRYVLGSFHVSFLTYPPMTLLHYAFSVLYPICTILFWTCMRIGRTFEVFNIPNSVPPSGLSSHRVSTLKNPEDATVLDRGTL